MRQYMKRCFLLLVAGLALGSCEPNHAPWHPQELGFTRYQPIYMDVAFIEVVDDYKSPMALPNVEHLWPYSPSEAMHIWANDRLHAVGKDKTLQVIIKDASIIAKDTPAPDGVGGLIAGPDKRYDLRLDVELRIYGTDPMSMASVHATATRHITVNSSTTIRERDVIYRRTIFNLMEDMNAQLEKSIFKYFGDHISYSYSQ